MSNPANPMREVYESLHVEGESVSGCPICYPLNEIQQRIADTYRKVASVAAYLKEES